MQPITLTKDEARQWIIDHRHLCNTMTLKQLNEFVKIKPSDGFRYRITSKETPRHNYYTLVSTPISTEDQIAELRQRVDELESKIQEIYQTIL